MFDKKILFSILIPNLGFSDVLFDCFKSVCFQKENNLFDYEIIVCDQSDYKIYENIVKKAKELFGDKIKFIHSNVRSLFRARHTLMEHSRGDYIVFVDSDDFVADDYLESIYNDLKSFNFPDILIHHVFSCDYNGTLSEKQSPFPSDIETNVMNYFLYSFIINSVVMKIFKKRLYELGDYDIDSSVTNGEDKVFSLPLMKSASTIFVNAHLDKYFYRQNKESMVHNPNFSDIISTIKFAAPPHDLAPKTPYQKEIFVTCLFTYFTSSTINLVCNSKITFENFKQLTKMIDFEIKSNSLNLFHARGTKNKILFLLLFFKFNRLLHYILKQRAKKYS